MTEQALIPQILIPLDGSSFSEVALKYVKRIVDTLKPASMPVITLLRVVPFPIRTVPIEGGVFSVPPGPEEMEAERAEAATYLEGAAATLRDAGATVNCLARLSEVGVSSAASIIRAEEDTGADLVAMSTHGRRGLTRWAFGSVTEKVLRGGNVPVLMVRVKK
jgi:nucleotide-binding universal stress UspA family protein